jgi:hypothetical protein
MLAEYSELESLPITVEYGRRHCYYAETPSLRTFQLRYQLAPILPVNHTEVAWFSSSSDVFPTCFERVAALLQHQTNNINVAMIAIIDFSLQQAAEVK